jgi:hypothetical protein
MTHALLNSYRIFNNAWGNMTNPINKKTTEQFVSKINPDLGIEILAEYVNTDTKIEYRCKHGTHSSLPWQILKFKHCCRAGYYESGKMWEKRTNTLDELKDRALIDRTDIDVTECYIDTSSRYKRLTNIKCTKHDIYYSSIAANKTGQCPECRKENNMERLKTAQIAAWASQSVGIFVSKAETKWLDGLNIKDRQVWLKDVQYKVDGFDQSTNTVYLYHGRFWHGCPNTFDPDMIHPVVKLPMKDLYEKTMLYENKIKDAGYNLIVEWGH